MISDWDLHANCGIVCEICEDTCDKMVGHGDECHFKKHIIKTKKINHVEPIKVITRPQWASIWLEIAHTISKRSYDPRLQVGAIIVTEDNTQMLAVGYNGNYKGGPHTHESTEPGKSGFIHAEINALVKCDYNNPKNKHMYVTHSPCRACAKLIINAGIKRVVYDRLYRDSSGIILMQRAGVDVYSSEEAILMAEK